MPKRTPKVIEPTAREIDDLAREMIDGIPYHWETWDLACKATKDTYRDYARAVLLLNRQADAGITSPRVRLRRPWPQD
jgi:hypothetical protein